MGTPPGDCPRMRDLAEEVPGEKECQLDELNCLRNLEQMIPPAQVQSGSWGIFAQSHGDHQCLTYLARGDHRRNTPGQ